MAWLWFAGPLTFIFLAVVFSVWPSDEERRLRRELLRWIDEMLGPLRLGKKLKTRRVRQVPAAFDDVVDRVGDGARITDIVLIPKLAYMVVRAADEVTSSNSYTVLCSLEHPAPFLEVRPLPIVDGRPVENKGFYFKDVDFMETYVADGERDKWVKKWLTKKVRKALLEFPDLWLRTSNDTMALTFYGYADAEMLDELLEVADKIFEIHGEGGDSLFGEPVATEDEEDEDDGALEPLATLPMRLKAGALDFGLYVVGGLLLTMVLGRFEAFHSSILFNSPDIDVTEAWQGGWTTKGFGALVAVESYVLGILALQAHLAVRSGQSIGKLLYGLRIVRADTGEKVGFVRAVLMRKWLIAAVPLIAAAATARPFGARAFFMNIPTGLTALVGAIAGVGVIGSLISNKNLRGVHDMVAGTEVIEVEPYRLPAVQLGYEGLDPVVFQRLMRGGAVLAAFVLVNIATYVVFGTWLLEVHKAWR